MIGFVYRLIPPRPTFASDMSPAERDTMMKHVRYWSALTERGNVIAFGPVDDGEASHGIAVVLAADRSEAEALRDADPAITSPHGFRAELAPMLQLVTPAGVYPA